jgi:Spy/CpxP family protein refolding chaperone
LVQDKEVQKELKLSPEQIQKVETVFAQVRRDVRQQIEDAETPDQVTPDDREKRVERREKVMTAVMGKATKTVAEILTPEQIKRVNQILLQRQGAQAFMDPKVHDLLRLTADQRAKLKAITEGSVQEMRNVFRTPQGDVEEMRKDGMRRREEAMAKALAVLSADQRAAWNDLKGAPYEVRPNLPGAGGLPVAPAKEPANRHRFTVAGPRPGTVPGDRAWVQKQVTEWQPSREERRVDDIGWVKGLREALRLGKEHDRPVLVFTYDGNMEVGRC